MPLGAAALALLTSLVYVLAALRLGRWRAIADVAGGPQRDDRRLRDLRSF
jgi:hypothetical protein